MQTLQFNNELPVTHVYSYSKCMSESDMVKIAYLIKKSPSVKVLIWSHNIRETITCLELKDF